METSPDDKRSPVALQIGERIRQRLAELSMNQQELAEKSGVPASTIANLLNGLRVPGAQIIVRLAEALGVTTDYVLLGKGVRKSTRLAEIIREKGVLESSRQEEKTRWRRSWAILEKIQVRREERKQRLLEWRSRAKNEIAERIELLGKDTPERKAAESLIDFFTRYALPWQHGSRRLRWVQRDVPVCDEKPEPASRTAVRGGPLMERLRLLVNSQLEIVRMYLKDATETKEPDPLDQAIEKLRGMTKDQLAAECKGLFKSLGIDIDVAAKDPGVSSQDGGKQERKPGHQEESS